jgi:hypothetical protein
MLFIPFSMCEIFYSVLMMLLIYSTLYGVNPFHMDSCLVLT